MSNLIKATGTTRPACRHMTILLATTMLTAGMSPALAQQAGGLDDIVVTAQKREENLQKVPLSIQAFGTQKLDQLQVSNFNDYAKFLPSVAFQTLGPGASAVYMRGVASGGDGNHSGSQPSVGIYLDEQPITTIQGALDVHIYDIARVEALAGPQGTLYGASSQAGTLRIITNKPDPSKFAAGYDLEVNSVRHGDVGYIAESFVNAPVSDNAAIRIVAWYDHEPGYIDNKAATRTFRILHPEEDGLVDYPDDDITINNDGVAGNDYNEVDTYGARAALRIDLNDNWTVTPGLMGQVQKSKGSFAYDPEVGDLAINRYYPEKANDKWLQATLTVEGRIGNFDLVYAGAFLKRKVTSESDYSDYSFFYDECCGYSTYIYDNDGNFINPSQYIHGIDRFTRQSHELRLSSPKENRLRFVGGLFYQRQRHNIQQDYIIDDLSDDLAISTKPDNIWLTKQIRIDRDYAAFGELSYDLTDKLTATGGIRVFKSHNTLEGFFGFGSGYSSGTGEAACFTDGDGNVLPPTVAGAPCTNLDKGTKETDFIHRLNLTYRITDDALVYATWSRGYRPGGINRRGTLPPYKSDFLTNYEIGWKTSWLDNRVRFNGAFYWEDWKNFQFSILGAQGLTEIKNAGQARIKGVETDVTIAVADGLTLSGAAAYTDAKLHENYCGFVDENGDPETVCPDPEAPKGTRLPVTPKFKGNATARYEFALGELEAHVQGSIVHQSASQSDLRLFERSILGKLPSYTTFDFSFGVARGNWHMELYAVNLFDERGQVTRYTQCAEAVCGDNTYYVPIKPRTVGLKFGQKF